MKNLVWVVFVLILGLSFISDVYSQEKEKKETKKEAMKEAKENMTSKDQDMTADKVLNTVCPVSTEDADPEITYTYKGKTYALCCNKCLKKFKADPEKYISRLSEDGKSIKKNN